MPPEDLPVDEVNRLTERIRADLTRLSESEAVHAVLGLRFRGGVPAVSEDHQVAIRKAVITDAIEHSEVYDEDAYAEASSTGEEAKSKFEDALADFERDVDRLHEMICEGRTAEACDLLRAMAPEHPFMSDAAHLMLAGIRGAQL